MPAQTTLAAAIASAGATTCTVRDVLGFAPTSSTDDLVLIDSEFVLVGAGMGTTSWSSLTRGYAGSTAATHADGATVTRIERGWTDLVHSKRGLGLAASDTADDALLLDYIESTNAELDFRVGTFLGPSTDTVRTYDGRDAEQDGWRLWVPGGIRTLTQVRIADSDAGTMVTQALANYLLRPAAHQLRPGQPYPYIEVTSEGEPFPACLANVELTGTFGPAAVHPLGRQIASMVVSRMYNARTGGNLANPSPSKFIYSDDDATLRAMAAEHFALVA